MEAHLLGQVSLHLYNPSDPQALLRALGSAKALLVNPNSSDTTRRAIVDALSSMLRCSNGDFTFLRYAIKLLGDVAALHGVFSRSIIELFQRFLNGDKKLAAGALSVLSSVNGFLLNEDLALSLASSQLVSARSMLVKLLVSSLEGDKRNILVMKPHAVIRALLGLSEDLYPLIKAKAVDGLVSVCWKTDSGVSLRLANHFYNCAASFLRNEEELIRLSATRLISACGQLFESNKGDARYCELINAGFVLLCVMARDMNMKVRVQAFSALGKAKGVSENTLLQSLSKKILRTSNKENFLTEPTLRYSKFPLACSAGAFVHGIEDEFLEVRLISCKSLGNLSILSVQFAAAALDLLMDLVNDDVMAVRLQTLETLYQMAAIGCFIIQERHVHMFLALLSDISSVIRFATRKLLQLVKFPKLETFKATISSLLTNMETHPEEEEDVFLILFCLGRSNPKFVLKLAKDFVALVEPFSAGELSLDTPSVTGHLVLIVSSTFSDKQKITDFPIALFSYAVPLAGRISRSLGGFVSQYQLSNYLCQISGIHSSFGIPLSEDTELAPIKVGEDLANFLKFREWQYNSLSLHDEKLKNLFNYDRLNLCQESTSCELSLEEGNVDASLTRHIKLILGKVQDTWSFIHSNRCLVARRKLRDCKEELDFISVDISEGAGADFSAFGLVYVEVFMLVAEIWHQMHATSFHVTGMSVSDILIVKLNASLRQIKYCFAGFSIEEECHLLELTLLSDVLQLHKFGICSLDELSKKMHATISRLLLLCEQGSTSSDFIEEVKKLCTEEWTSESFPEFPVIKLVQLFYPRFVSFQGKFRHIKADLMVLGRSSECPLRYVSGLPVGITFDVVLRNIFRMEKVWLQMAVGGIFQHIFVDICNFKECNNIRRCTLTLPFYETPRTTSFVLKACIYLELPAEGVLHRKKDIRGPKHDSIQISKDIEIYFVSVESYYY